MLQRFSGIETQVISVERDVPTAVAFATTHKAIFCKAQPSFSPNAFLNGRHWIKAADVFDRALRLPLANWMPHIATISAPCPPWSGAAHAPGLAAPDGRALMHILLEIRWLRPHLILIEQVLSFNSHPHEADIIRTLHHVGYRLVFQKTLDMQAVSLTSRIRWLGLAERVHADLIDATIQRWPQVEHSMHPTQSCTWRQIRHRRPQLPTMLHPFASEPKFTKRSRSANPSDVLHSKIFAPGSMLPTFMAMYRTQHDLDEHLLKSHGYLGHFVQDSSHPKGYRFLARHWDRTHSWSSWGMLLATLPNWSQPNAWQHDFNAACPVFAHQWIQPVDSTPTGHARGFSVFLWSPAASRRLPHHPNARRSLPETPRHTHVE